MTMIIIAVFRARAQSLDYAERLRRYGVAASVMPTPKEARIGCGLCVRFEAREFARANAILKMGRYTSFKGFYRMNFTNGNLNVTPYVE